MKFTKHPMLKGPSDEEIVRLTETEEGCRLLIDWHEKHENLIRLAKENPVYHGFVLDAQKKVEDFLLNSNVDEVWVFGGWRSGKSRSAAKIVVQSCLENPNQEVICWAQNEDASVERQQPYIYEMLPPDLKTKRKGEVEKISYHPSTGFSGNKLIFPNGSKIYFKYYTQFLNDNTMLEGANLGCLEEDCNWINVGSWLDEYLGDSSLVERVRGRCSEKNSKIIITFTPIHGYTETVKGIMEGAVTAESKPASLLGGKHMPVVQDSKKKENAKIVFYHTEDNPWANFKRLERDLKGKTEEEIKKLAYGYPEKSIKSLFRLDSSAHIYDPEVEKYDFSNTNEWCTYQFIDPAGARAWACIWCSVNAKRDIRIWAEFPRRSIAGEWAVEGKGLAGPSGVSWKVGPAAKDYAGLSIRELLMEFKKVERGIPVFERVVDVRFCHNPRTTLNDGKKTLQDDLFEAGVNVVTADGGLEEDGISAIHELLSFNSEKPFCANTNCPRLRISKECGNLLHSLGNYTKNGARDEALRDFIDLVRYMARHDGDGIRFWKNILKQVRPSGIL